MVEKPSRGEGFQEFLFCCMPVISGCGALPRLGTRAKFMQTQDYWIFLTEFQGTIFSTIGNTWLSQIFLTGFLGGGGQGGKFDWNPLSCPLLFYRKHRTIADFSYGASGNLLARVGNPLQLTRIRVKHVDSSTSAHKFFTSILVNRKHRTNAIYSYGASGNTF